MTKKCLLVLLRDLFRIKTPYINNTIDGRAFLSKKTISNCPENVAPKNASNYNGPSNRCLHNRAEERIRPIASQKPNSITLHRLEHENSSKIINHGSDMVDTHIKEGLTINQLKRSLKEKDELIHWLGNLNNIRIS